MRWFVQVSTIGKKAPADKLCLEGPHWQAALLAARKLRNDVQGLAGLSVEIDGTGCIAIDPASRVRYQVERAPDDAPLTDGSAAPPFGTPTGADAVAPASAGAPAAAAPPAADGAAKRRSARGKTVAFSSAGMVKELAKAGGAPPAPPPPAASGATPPQVPAAAPAAQFAPIGAPAVFPAGPFAPAPAVAVEAAPPGKRQRSRTISLSSRGDALALEPPREAPVVAPANASSFASAPTMPSIGAPIAPPVGGPPSVVVAIEPEPAPPTTAAAEPIQPVVVAPAPPPAPEPAPAGPAAIGFGDVGSIPYQVLASRAVEPSPQSPLAYRERVFAVTAVLGQAELEAFMRARLDEVRAELAQARAGKVVNLALFDHVYSGRPERPPVVTVSWKDWRGDEPTIVFSPYGPNPVTARPSTAPPPHSGGPAPAAQRPSFAPAGEAPPAARPASVPPPGAHSRSTPPPAAQRPLSTPPAPHRPPSTPPVAAAAPVAARPASTPPVAAQGSYAPVPSPQGYAPVPGPQPAPPAAPSPQAAGAQSYQPVYAPIPEPPAQYAPIPAAPAPAQYAPIPAAPAPAQYAPIPAAPAPAQYAPIPAAPAPAPAPAPTPYAPVPSVAAAHYQPQPQPPAPAASNRPGVPRPGARPQPRPAPAPVLSPRERALAIEPRPLPQGAVRVAGDDLLTDLFEAMSDLHFLAGAFEGADFVLDLTLQKLPSEVGLLSLFDINRREYVVVRQIGGARSGLLLRIPENQRMAETAMRAGRAELASAALDGRWAEIGATPRSLACAPVEHGGRYLGLIELCNPLDGKPFSDSDGHALTYIGRQYGEFLAERSVMLDVDAVLQGLERG